MKISSNLLKAMVVTATLSASTGCALIKPKVNSGSNPEFNKPSILQIFQRNKGGDPCPSCGMG